MLKPFFVAAMLAPGRQLAFRRMAVAHVLLVSGLGYAATAPGAITSVGYLMLILGLVEGAALIGWRLTQIPKSQALEFLLTSPVQPRGVFLAEALVGVGRFSLVWLAGLPVLGGLMMTGAIGPDDLMPLFVMPFVWGIVAGLGLTAWVYEPRGVRRVGEILGLLGVLIYLVVGVVAGEHLRLWLNALPESIGRRLFDGVVLFHTLNPFGVVRYWFDPNRVDWLVRERFELLHLFALALIVLTGLRAAYRLKGHFHDRHYQVKEKREKGKCEDGDLTFSLFLFPFSFRDQPLSWWAARRVMEYSGRVNLWLAGGFALLYAAYIVAGDDWPSWMGRLVFQIFESWGGAPVVATALVVLAAVPAVYQYGLWDSTVQNRCRRLELLLLTDLSGIDYWRAALAAAWQRGRGYLVGAGVLWLALGIAGRNGWPEVLAAVAGGTVLWAFSFAVGFRAFAAGNQSNGVASLVTLGLPLLVFGLLRMKLSGAAALVPTGLCYLPLRDGVTGEWAIGLLLTGMATAFLARRGLTRCASDLRQWYDRNQGKKSVE